MLVLGVWLAAAVGVGVLVLQIGTDTNDNVTLPGTDSQAAADLLADEFPPQQNGSSPIVFYAPQGKVTDAQNRQAIEASFQAIKKVPHVYSATDPFSQQGAAQISKDAKTAFISVLLDIGTNDLTADEAQPVLDAAHPGVAAGMQVAAGGPIGDELSVPETESSELIGIVAAMVILTFAFGTLVAMGMPIVTAVVGLVLGLALLGLLGHLVQVPSITPTLATMIGLGVGIDYALFLVRRHLDQLRDGMEVRESIALAVAKTGTGIVFAGTTVVIALLALAVAGIPLVTALGYGSAVAVVTAVVAAITLMPALLALVGHRITALRLPTFLRPGPKERGEGFWAGWARLVTAHPLLAILAAALILVPLAIPVFWLRLGQEDIGATPTSTTQRQAYDLMAAGFGPGYNGPFLIATSLSPPATADPAVVQQENQLQMLQAELEQEQKQGQEQQQELQQQGDALKRQQASLQRQQASLKQQQASLKQQQTKLENEEASLKQQQASLERQSDQLKQQQSALESQEASLRQQQAALESQAQALQANRSKLEAQQAALKRQAEALRAESERLRRAGEALVAHAKRLAGKKELRSQEAKLRREAAALASRAEAARQQAASLAAQEAELARQVSALASQAAELERQKQSLESQAAQLQQQAAQLQQQAAQLQQQAAQLQQEGAQLQSQADELERQGAQLQQEGAALQQQATKLQQQGNELKAQQQQLEALQRKAKQQQQQAEQLKDQLTKELTKAGGDERGTDPRLVSLQDALTTTSGVALLSPPNINDSGGAATFTLIPTTAPADPKTADLVRTLRSPVIPKALKGSTGIQAHVGGSTAANVDLAAEIADSLPLVIVTVLGLSILVLLLAFRSLLVPVQAAVTNIVCVAASFGVLTACFQWGWGLGLVGIDTPTGTDPIASYVPLMMFAVLFGLSMDYQVFLLSQVDQHRAEGESDDDAVCSGLALSARVITAAALIMIFVFGSFILNGDPVVKQFGVGLAVAVALAATMVLLLAPALLVLLGRWTWWLPHLFARLLPRVDIEGRGLEAPAVAPAAAGASAAGAARNEVPLDERPEPEPAPRTRSGAEAHADTAAATSSDESAQGPTTPAEGDAAAEESTHVTRETQERPEAPE
jgi:uncharacterized membrane protein YdfJ with MMPL/SSD domain